MPRNSSQFSVSLDIGAKLITGFVFCLMASVTVLGLAIAHNLYVAVAGLPILALCYAWAPRGYAVENGSIAVKRLLGEKRISLEGAREIRAAAPDDFSGAIRLWANGGVFGYYGVFRTSKLGKCSWYVTDRNKRVVVITAGKTYVFSPDDVDGFLAAVRAFAPAAGSAPGPIAPMPAGRGAGTWIGFAIGAVALGVTALAFLYSPGAPACTLTASSLTIHDRFYPVTVPAADVDLAAVRVVDLTSDLGWKTTARTNGFANAHYQSGWFRVANGARVQLYRAGSNRLVLIPPKASDAPPILLQTADPEAFIARLKQAWAGK
jgi:hypothetical protein